MESPFKISAGNFGKIEFTIEEKNRIVELLQQKLKSDEVETRPGPGNSEVTYIESWKSIELANHVFGYDGWSCQIIDITTDFEEPGQQGKFKCGVTAVVRVSLKDGTYHEDVGYGSAEDRRKGAALEHAKKEAVSDARKRAFRLFGNRLGNCLYDKSHLKQVKADMIKNKYQSNQANGTSNVGKQEMKIVANSQSSQINMNSQPSPANLPMKPSSPSALHQGMKNEPTNFKQQNHLAPSSSSSSSSSSHHLSPTVSIQGGSPSNFAVVDNDFDDLDLLNFDMDDDPQLSIQSSVQTTTLSPSFHQNGNTNRPVGQKSGSPTVNDVKDLTPPDKRRKNFIEVH